MDGAWRLKAGFVAAVFLGAFVVLWPTLDSALPTANTPVPEQPAWLGALARAGRSVASRAALPGVHQETGSPSASRPAST